jgi:hypothetical protein
MKSFTKQLIVILVLFLSLDSYSQVPKLNSLSSATATIFLDFDGHTVQSASWNNGTRFTCAPSVMNAAQITEVFNRVSEDYRPFNINITTDSAKFLAAPLSKRVRIIVTPTSAWYPGVGGISYIGSFTWGDDTPGFVFCDRLANDAKFVAECCTHESGHTVGLSHQSAYNSDCQMTEQYNQGTGVGETSWAPVMGNSYYKNMTGWNDGPTPYGCSSTQDNLTIITSLNGFGYRTDDFTEILDNSTYALSSNNFHADGIITTNTDKDAFRYVNMQNSIFHLDVHPYGISGGNSGSNLDVEVKIYDASKNIIGTYNPLNTLGVLIDTALNAGTYYVVISGTGNSNISEYGSLGSYTLTGYKSALAIRDISLTGNSDGAKHNLNWSVTADEPIQTQVVEVSNDGIAFRTLATYNGTVNRLTYTPELKSTFYYRIKVTSALQQVAYSNIVALRAADNAEKLFTVSTLVTSEITINAAENFKYRLNDVNGKMIGVGVGNKGINRINVQNNAAGMYVIQLIGDNSKQTERIIKQ